MEEKTDLPTQRRNTGQYPQLQLEKRLLCGNTNPDQSETLNLDRSNDEITLFNAEPRSSCDITNSSGLNASSGPEAILRQQIADLQCERKKQQQVSIFSRN